MTKRFSTGGKPDSPGQCTDFFPGNPPARSSAARVIVALSTAVELVTGPMDLILIALLGLLLATLLAFVMGVIPYPYGLIVLAALIAARILCLRGPRKPR
ncbi:MAG: hypothetical protein WAL92_11805 [Thiogranum sp.]